MKEIPGVPRDEQLIAGKVSRLAAVLCNECPPYGLSVGKLIVDPNEIQSSQLPDPIKKFFRDELSVEPNRSVVLYSDSPEGSVFTALQLAIYDRRDIFVSSIMVTSLGNGTRKHVDIHVGHGKSQSPASKELLTWVSSDLNTRDDGHGMNRDELHEAIGQNHLYIAEQILDFADVQIKNK